MKQCKVEGCDNTSDARGYCPKHYAKAKRYGDPLASKGLDIGVPLAWMKSMVASPPDECVEYPYSTGSIYGQLSFRGKNRPASRVALILWTGEDPSDKFAAHGECHNPRCCNPKHLYWATPQQNSLDRERDKTLHYGSAHPNAKLNEVAVVEIRSTKLGGEVKRKDLAEKYGVSEAAITAVRAGKNWWRVPNTEATSAKAKS